jgi:hypothetical protein
MFWIDNRDTVIVAKGSNSLYETAATNMLTAQLPDDI